MNGAKIHLAFALYNVYNYLSYKKQLINVVRAWPRTGRTGCKQERRFISSK